MTLGFVLFTVGMALVASALKDKSVSEIFSGVLGPDVPFGTPKNYTVGSNDGGAGSAAGDILSGAADLPVHLGKAALKLIGFPFQGTHTLGNWQSDRAVDISVPTGTPIYATVDGTVNKVRKGSGGRFAGFQVTVGNEAFFAHLSRAVVRAGQRVKAGDLIGYSGSANGVEHLHYARRTGDLPK